MKHNRFYISLNLIIPFIFTGYAILAVMITFRLTKYGIEQGNDPTGIIFWFLAVISILAFGSGFALVRFILKPVETFVENAEKLASLSTPTTRRGRDWSGLRMWVLNSTCVWLPFFSVVCLKNGLLARLG